MGHHPIIQAIAEQAKLTPELVLTDRQRDTTAWRQIAMVLMRDSGMTFMEIARITGRDPSTVNYTCKKLGKLKGKPWFEKLRAEVTARATALNPAPNPLWERPTPRLYAMAWACPD